MSKLSYKEEMQKMKDEFKKSTNEAKDGFKKGMAKNKKVEPSFKERYNEKIALAEEKDRHRQQSYKEYQDKSETEKFAKTGIMIAKGMSFWFLIPFFFVAAVILLFVVFGILDWLGIISAQ